ncbi:polyamine-transporting ATPase 13A2 isoform X2 [Cherax quadricarinatus]|uniref:polyamine-transporting ATPase 13A2 isoform X2 n=1 Tax=Cherax quadricarinatus TaxID=27406 RepID=UPI00387E3A35
MWGTKATADRLNLGTKDELEVTGYRRDPVKLALTVVATVATGGLLLILITWRPSIKLALTHRRCSLLEANKLLLKDTYHQLWEEEVVREEARCDTEAGVDTLGSIYFTNKKIKYIWDDATCTFVRLRPFDNGATFNTFQQASGGLGQATAQRRQSLFGENFMRIEILSIWQLLVQQAYNPFYIFQAYAVVLWMAQHYFLFAGCIAGLSIISTTLIVWETRRQSRALRKTVTSQSEVMVLRDGQRREVSSRELVPGDVVLISDTLHCLEVDAVLLQGSVITNEAMLTGESIPVTKVGVPFESHTLFTEEEHRHHLLFSGTQVLQVRGASELPALVVNTGFNTARGELVRSILFPKPIDFHFYTDFLKLLVVFLVLGVMAMIYSFVLWYRVQATWHEILLNTLDLITFVVPPILPATVTAINVWAQHRLKKQGIFSLSSNYISLAGSIDIVCFDKTGTLTEDDLALAGVVPCVRGDLVAPVEDLMQLSPDQPLTKALASCHSLTLIDGRLVGYPLDVKIFDGIGWTLQEPSCIENPDYGMVTLAVVQPGARECVDPQLHQVAILKTFPFESREQRMTVVTRSKTSTALEVFIKGAPEKVASLCTADTVPSIMEAALEWYSRQGLRVLAVASKYLGDALNYHQQVAGPRDVLEMGSTFLGLVLLHNKLKVETAPVLATLHKAAITTVMVTGDNLLTALSVARQSEMVPISHQVIVVKATMEATSTKAAQHLKVIFYDADYNGGLYNQRKMISLRNDNYVLATEGESFDLIANSQDKDLFQRLLHKGRVFARMKPEQKITVVEALQDLGHHVAMCGDGCNDCGALKVANAGISLSSAEASVAAPFTSKKENIACVLTVIREGRATLVSIFSAFKYNVVSYFGALICVLFHFSINMEPSDVQYLIQDLLLITIPALVMGNTGAPPYLTPTPPTQRVLSFLPSASMFSFLGLQALVYWAMLAYVRAQPWFEPFVYKEYRWPPETSYENTTLIIMSFFSVIIGAFVYSHAAPYRKPIYTNYTLTAYLLLATTLVTFITFYKGLWLRDLLNFRDIPDLGFSGVLFFTACINCAVCFIWERWVLYGVVQQYVLPWLQDKCGSHQLYIQMETQLQDNPQWPPLTEPPESTINEMSNNGKPMMDEEELDADEECGENNALMRKLTHRHHFKASVKYLPRKLLNKTNTELTVNVSSVTEGSEYESLISQNSYSVPCPTPESARHQGPGDDHETFAFKFNQSVRHQIMKGTGGAFRTFKGSVKRQNALDESTSQPYQMISFSSTAIDEPAEVIYATISEIPPHNSEQRKVAVPVHSNTSQEQEGEQTSAEEKNENEAFSTDANSRPLTIVENPDPSSEQIYDIPKPPRPVEGPYSPVSSQEINAGEFLRERRSLLSDEASEQWKNDESTC